MQHHTQRRTTLPVCPEGVSRRLLPENISPAGEAEPGDPSFHRRFPEIQYRLALKAMPRDYKFQVHSPVV
ncbi:MAG: hypothetical protein R3C12_00775 [Planctomycetaceae bacterium]